jgi:hypothetical protein
VLRRFGFRKISLESAGGVFAIVCGRFVLELNPHSSSIIIFFLFFRRVRTHAEVFRKGSKWFVMDTSTNGTYVNGYRVKKSALKNLDLVAFGMKSFTFLI